MDRLSRMHDSNHQPGYILSATSNTASPDDVLVRIELNFATACQVMKAIAAQSWQAAIEDLVPRTDFRNETPPTPVVFSLFGRFK